MQNEPSKEVRGIVPVSQRVRQLAADILAAIAGSDDDAWALVHSVDRGASDHIYIVQSVTRFEAETRKDERERCARVAASIGEGSSSGNGQIVAARIAAAIRNQEPQP